MLIAPALNAFSGEQKSSELEDFFEFLRGAGGLLVLRVDGIIGIN
jgi:hypothetical protein